MTLPELPPDLHERIEALAAEGDALAAEARYEEAIGVYDRAWALVDRLIGRPTRTCPWPAVPAK